MYPIGSNYISVHINRVKNQEFANDIKKFVGRIFSIYLSNKEAIISEYVKFIPTFKEYETKMVRIKSKKTNNLTDLAPDIFVAGYARLCADPPTIIDDIVGVPFHEAKSYTIPNPHPKYLDAMMFPKTEEEGKQHWYGCEGQYVGLRKNKITDSDFPYLPCCYSQDQTVKKSYNDYYYDMKQIPNKKPSSYILTTPKFLNKGEIGTLPKNLDVFLQTIIMDKDANFYRTGSAFTTSSFIDAVSSALGKSSVLKLRAGLFALCRQNAYSKTTNQLITDFKNTEKYFNPNIYYRLLEEYFKCYICLFTINSSGEGAILHPVYKHNLLRYKRENRPLVLILEHMGSESDSAQYPQCEAIIMIKGKEKTSFFTGDFANEVLKYTDNMTQWYSGSNGSMVKYIDYTLFEGQGFSNIRGQGFDSAGKTRALKVGDIYIITDPLPPLDVEEFKSYNNNKKEDAIKFIEDQKLEYIDETPDRFIVRKNNMIFQIPFNITVVSSLSLYNQNQRIARYLQEYSYYMYSFYAKTHGMNPENINSFLRENTIVKNDYKYPKIGRKFDVDGGYFENRKLIVQNNEMAQRLGYSIELLMRRNKNYLENYHQLELIQDYYLDKNDFTKDENAIILMTDEALRNWIQEEQFEYKILDIPSKSVDVFYILINENLVLVQKANSFDSAVGIANNWNSKKYNSQERNIEDKISHYSYYIYETPYKITRFGDHENKVLIWKEDDQLYYGAILD